MKATDHKGHISDFPQCPLYTGFIIQYV